MSLLYKSAESIARGLSPSVWASVPMENFIDPGFGVFRMYDFVVGGASNVVADFTTTVTGSSAAAAVSDSAFGNLVLTPGTTADDSSQIQHGHGEWVKLASDGTGYRKFIMETRLKIATVVANGGQFFTGLSSTDTTILAAGANSAADHLGLQLIEATAIKIASDTTAAGAVLTTITGVAAADTFLQLAMVVDVPTGTVKVYHNGLLDTVTTANTLPTLEMRPSIAGGCGTTTQDATTVDWVAFAALC